MGGLDRAKIKHLLKIFWPPPQYKKDFFIYDFCAGEDAKCLAHFAASKMRQTRRSRIEQPWHNHEASDLASAERSPRPQAGQAVDTPQAKPAPAGGALDH